MDHGTLALIIPILALSIPIVAIWSKHRKDIAGLEAESAARSSTSGASANAERLAALEDRVRVLERIVTDPGHDVASQIDALRDQDTPLGRTVNQGAKRENVE